MDEPFRLTRCASATNQINGQLFTCSKPGRSMGPSTTEISDECVREWIAGLPTSMEEIIIISLLGRKPTGLSEFSYYSSRGGFDQPGCPTFQEWLDLHYMPSRYHFCEYPATDTLVIPNEIKYRIVTEILFLEHRKNSGCRRLARLSPPNFKQSFQSKLVANCHELRTLF